MQPRRCADSAGLGAVGLGQLHGIDQRGVVELVGEYRVATASQGRRDGEVGEVAGGEGQGAFETGEGAIRFPSWSCRRQVAADQVRGAAAAPAQRAVGHAWAISVLPARPR